MLRAAQHDEIKYPSWRHFEMLAGESIEKEKEMLRAAQHDEIKYPSWRHFEMLAEESTARAK